MQMIGRFTTRWPSPEFAFYGPIGYDLGNVVGNLYCATGTGRARIFC
jgi:5-methylthioribose kinase